MRQELPVNISNEMKLWRMGFESFPKSYINFHKELAEQALEELKTKGIIVHDTYMESDGWMDGMKVLWATIEKDGKLFEIKWNDGNQEFFMQSSSGGSFPFRLEK